MRASSPGASRSSLREAARARRRLLLEDVVAGWPCGGVSLPVPVILKRLAAPRWVFILGMACLLVVVAGGAGAASLGARRVRSAPRPRRRCRLPVAGRRLGSAGRRVLGVGRGGGRRLGAGRRRRRPRRRRCGRLGCAASLARPGPCLSGAEHHGHVAAVELGDDLDLARRARRASATWSRIRRPSSGWCISRPRNMIVTLTLWPSPRNFSTLRVLVSKSPLADLGAVLHLLDGDVARSCAGTPWPAAPPRTCTCRSP